MIIPKSYAFEVLIGSTPQAGLKLNFPNNLGQLNGKKIIGIEVYSADQLTNGVLTYATNTSAAGCRQAVLTLVEGTTEKVKEIPLYDLIPQVNGGLQRELEPFICNISKSYIKLVATSAIVLNNVFVVNFIYL